MQASTRSRETDARISADERRVRKPAGPLARAATVAGITLGAVVLTASGAAAAAPGQVIGHRGGNDTGPENALETFKHAVAVGADAVEFDVRFTSDAVPVIMHDDTMDRMTNCSGKVNSMTAAKVQSCIIDVVSGARQGVPTLEQTLATLAPTSAKLYVHVKEGSSSQAQKIVGLLNKYNLNTTSGASNRSVVFADAGSSSFLTNVKAAGAKRIGTIFNDSSGWKSSWPVIIAYNTPVTRSLVAAAQKAGKFVIAVEDHPVTASQVDGLSLNGFMANELDGYLIRIGRLEDPAVTAARLAAEKAAAEAAAKKAAEDAANQSAAQKAAAERAAESRGVQSAAQRAARR